MNLVTNKEKLLSGIKILDTAVSSTLGPRGRTVIIQKEDNSLHLTKDGVTVSNYVTSEDEVEKIGIELVKKAASIAVEKTGDGTTTATVLACELINKLNSLFDEYNPYEIRKGMKAAASDICKYIDNCKIPVKESIDLTSIASIAANNDTYIGELVGNLMYNLNADSVVNVSISNIANTTVDYINGYSFDKGLINSYFVTEGAKNKAVLKDVKILIYDKKLISSQAITNLLRAVMADNKSLLIIADDVDEDALANLIALSVNKTLKLAIVRAPKFGDEKYEMLEDISIYCGGLVLSESKGITLPNAKYEYLGEADEVIITSDKTVIIGGKGSASDIDLRINQIKNLITPDITNSRKDGFNNRIACLNGSIAEIKIGGGSDIEKLEVKDRVDDAIGACNSAKKHGLVKGGGFILFDASHIIANRNPYMHEDSDFKVGYYIVLASVLKPAIQIIKNAGFNSATLLETYKNTWLKHYISTSFISEYRDFNPIIINSLTGEFVEFDYAKIYDPAEVVKVSLNSAVNIASEFITFECILLNTKKNERENKSSDFEQIY